MQSAALTRTDRLSRTIAGEAVDRAPVTLWRRWPGDDQRAADFAASMVAFQRDYDWDLLNICPADHALTIDYGGQDEWRGHLDGTRTILKRGVTKSLDWTILRPLDPTRGAVGRLSDAVALIAGGVRDAAPLLVTIPSPLAQARELAGDETLLLHLRTQPDRLHSGLNTLTETTLRLIDTLKRLPLAGVCYGVHYASPLGMAEDEYRVFGLPYDRKIFESFAPRWWLNMLHFQQPQPFFRLVGELRPAVVSWRDQEGEPDLAQGKLLVGGAVCGGWHSETHLHLGTPPLIRDAARDALSRTHDRRVILSAGMPVPVTTPLSNLRAARQAVERM